MTVVDLCFPTLGETIPVDHGYALYGAISRHLGPEFHERDGVGLFSITGLRTSPLLLKITDRSFLRIRIHAERIGMLLRLSGQRLEIDGHRIQLGVPRTFALSPACVLSARIVTIKGFKEPQPFLEAVQRQLDTHGIKGKPSIPLRSAGERVGEPVRRVMRIKDKKIVGFGLTISELTAEESLVLQEKGLGGRRHMSCGLFLPCKPHA